VEFIKDCSKNSKKIPTSFYQRSTVKVARELLGMTLVCFDSDSSDIRNSSEGSEISYRMSGTIVETEAYLGVKDLACHARNGLRSKRNGSLYLPGGHTYVYQIYGLHYCLNAVTKNADEPEAVLIRALEPIEGINKMKLNRKIENPQGLTNGPGKLCSALNITKNLDGLSLQSSRIFIEEPDKYPSFKTKCSARIGVDYAGEWAVKPLRFYIEYNKYVSK